MASAPSERLDASTAYLDDSHCRASGSGGLSDRLVNFRGSNCRPIRKPRVSRSCLLVLDPDGHRAEALQQTALGANRPQVVQEHLDGTPHRHPATDREIFANDVAKTTIAKVAGNCIANRYGRG